MKRFVLSVIACVCVSIGMQAAINVLTTNINGQDGYEINGWENPGEIAAFLNGTYSGDVINNGSPDANWATTLLPTIKSAKAIKLGSGASSESIGTADLQALALLTNVVYLRMDSSSPAADADFSQIAIGSSALLDVTLPTGVTKAQVVQANTALKTTATGLKLTTGVAGTIEITQVPHYWYTLPGSTTPIEYTGEVTEGQTTVTFENEDIQVPLTIVEGYPVSTYVNTKFNNEVTPVDPNDVIVDGKVSPASFKVPLTVTTTTTTVYKDGDNTWNAQQWWFDENGFVTSEHNGLGYAVGYQLTVETNTSTTATYTFFNGQYDGPVYEYTGEIYGNETDGYYGIVENTYPVFYKFDVTSQYQYTYVDLNGVTQTTEIYTSPQESVTLQYSGTRDLTTTYESVTNVIVEGVVACVNVVGSLSDATEFLYTGDQETIYKSGETITVIGTVNGDDLSYLSAANFASAKLIDVSETILDGSSTYGSLNDAPLTAALFLPNSVTKDELITLETSKTQNDSGHTCAYVANEDENGNRLMHVYAWDATVANLKPVVDNQTGLYFLKRYTSEGDAWAGAVYTSGNESFRLALAELPAISMDFTNYNAIMMPDFSHLSANTHYLVVPQNTADGLDAHNFTLDTNASNYKYTNDVWVVSTYKAVGVSATYADKTLTATETTNITYFRTADKLAGAAPFLSDQQKTASLQIFVTKDGVQLSENDMEAMKYVECNKMNFLDANVADESYIMFKNPFVKYVALPDNKNYLIRNNVILDDNTNKYTNPFPYLTNLKSVASYNTDYNLYTAYSSLNLDDNNKQIASVGYVTEMIKPSTASDRIQKNSTFAAGLTHMEMMGYFTPEDLSTDGDYYAHAGLNNATVEWIDLSKAYFPTKSDMAFCYYPLTNACGRIIPESIDNHYAWDNASFYHIDLPTHPDMDEIPDAAFFNMNKLGRGTIDDATEEEEKGWHSYYQYYTFSYDDQGNETVTQANFEGLCIPTNYKYIRRGAFLGCNGLNHVYTTQSNEGEEEGAWDHGANTITLSPYVLELETYAFWIGGDNGSLHDGIKGVYPLGKTAPKCQTRTFSTKMLCNNNAYNPAHPISIVSYQGGQQGLTILRYPNGLTDDEEKLYTDITREYSLIDETGLVDGDGNAIYWPTQSEITRSYMQGQLGYIWEDWDMTMAYGEYPAQSSSTYKFDGDCVEGQFAANVAESHLSANGKAIGYNDSWVEASQNTKVWFNERIGWHEFVVAWPGHVYDIDIQKEEVYYELGWYTFCVPTDLTVAEVAKYMGVVNTNPDKIKKKVFKTIKKKRASNYELDHGYSGLDNSTTAFGDDTDIPANMTYVLPDIRVLSAVERDLVNGHIQLHLSRDLAGNYAFDGSILNPIAKDNFDFEYKDGYFAGNPNTVLIKGGYPYLVRPIVPKSFYDSYIAGTESYPGPGKFTMARVPEPAGIEEGVGYPGYKKTIGSNVINVPYENYYLQATDPGHEGVDEVYEKDGVEYPYIYNFIGRYDDAFIPQYAYYMGAVKDASQPSILWEHKFYRAVNKADKKNEYYTTKKWGAYSAIITALGSADYYVYVPDINKEEDKDKKKSSYVYDYNDTDDDTVFKVGNTKFSVLFDGDEEDWEGIVDAIQSVTDGKVSASVNGKVYNVNGQMVGTSIQNLNKGLYIVNGKKYVVK